MLSRYAIEYTMRDVPLRVMYNYCPTYEKMLLEIQRMKQQEHVSVTGWYEMQIPQLQPVPVNTSNNMMFAKR